MAINGSKLLISNRGEIACRIIRSAKRLGMITIAVYSDADKHALHTQLADEAYYLGPSPSAESYLCGDKIIALAKQAGAQAIHPGYGFLSEDPEFALACEQANMIFVGPPPSAMRAMASKSAAKTQLESLDIPLIPGYHGKAQDTKTLKKAASTVGFPVLLKAAAGGGGRGMRLVHEASMLDEAIDSAKREAKAAFADDTLLIEKYLEHPRHIEIQLFVDKHGDGVYLFERDCSIQRRHQKIIEEAPAFHLPRTLIKKMGETAVTIAKAIGYVGAGTIEFLVDEKQHFYFMEMNTRLQVEHPITEMITGLDLVEWQLRIAFGEPLPCQQTAIKNEGHAIEVRLCAENPYEGFTPASGLITALHLPPPQSWLRIDTGFTEGDTISRFYDSMIAKLIVWGETREQAVSRLITALSAYRLTGVSTNRDLLLAIIQTSDYQQGNINTHFINEHSDLLKKPEPSLDVIAFTSCYMMKTIKPRQIDTTSPWLINDNWQLYLPATQSLQLQHDKDTYHVNIEHHYDHDDVFINGAKQPLRVELDLMQHISNPHNQTSTWEGSINQIKKSYYCLQTGDTVNLFTDNMHTTLTLITVNAASLQQDDAAQLHAPMPASVIAIPIQLKQQVKQGETLMVLEAMKMEHTIQAPFAGIITAIYFNIGQVVQEGSKLVDLEPIQ